MRFYADDLASGFYGGRRLGSEKCYDAVLLTKTESDARDL